MGLRDLIKRIRLRPPSGERVELKPAEQVALSHLLRFDSANAAVLHSVVREMGSALAPDIQEVIAALLGQGLIEARLLPDEGRDATLYVPTPKARRLKGRIPEDPRTVTEFWI